MTPPQSLPSRQPLTGLTLVTTALNVPGPMAAATLRDLGAAVDKIEPPEGDPLSGFASDWYEQLHAGTRVERCDLKSTAGRERMDALLSQADLLLTSSRPAALDRLGLGWQALHERFPRLCHVAIVGFPAPHQNLAGHDLTYLAAHGLLMPPHLPPTLFADVASAERAVSAALALLLQRERHGESGYAEVALAGSAQRLAQPLHYRLTRRGGVLGGGFPGYNLYRAADGWIAVAALEPHFYARLCELLAVPPGNHEKLAEQFARRPRDHWRDWAQQHDLPIEPIAADDAPAAWG